MKNKKYNFFLLFVCLRNEDGEKFTSTEDMTVTTEKVLSHKFSIQNDEIESELII
jgi:hypothetical protein